MSSTTSLTLHATSLIIIYSAYGYLQEKILRSSTYGPNNEHFTSSALLILCNRVFSIVVGLALLAWKTHGVGSNQGERGFRSRLRPASPIIAYAAVAVINFLSTTCQYEALRYVSYTTQSLAKTAKMIPVLVVGGLVYRKKYSVKEWIAGSVVLIGCAAYIFSAPPTSSSHSRSHAKSSSLQAEDSSFITGTIGAIFLLGYLFCDGLVSTTQEKVFGKNPKSNDPFGPESPVLDQMIWTNTFASLIALGVALLSNATGGLWPNLVLLMTSPALIWDVVVFSAASSLGLIILLNTIASFGALTCSLIMTTRQFLSILLNAFIFGNFTQTSIWGWCGVGWVASGVYIKMNKQFDRVDRVALPHSERGDESSLLGAEEEKDRERRESVISLGSPISSSSGRRDGGRLRIYFLQYAVPVAVPVLLTLAMSPVLYFESSLSSLSTYELRAVEGGKWEKEMHRTVKPTCWHNETTIPSTTQIRTGFASYPRSGNSYMRGMVERVTGFQTSSVYCDQSLAKTFHGECDLQANFFVKTHFPSLPLARAPGMDDYYKQFHQSLHLIRNPIDAISSWFQLDLVGYDENGHTKHGAKFDLKAMGLVYNHTNAGRMIDLAHRWKEHAEYWADAPLLTHTLRYEDLRESPISAMMGVLQFLIPNQELPSLTDLACLVELDKTHEAYESPKSTDFASWDLWDPVLRNEVLKIVRRPFCAFGYEQLLYKRMGALPEMDRFCFPVVFEDASKATKSSGPQGEAELY